ncbi:MAG: class I SAM-dependent methyltransferase [Cyanobacteriota bacterium]|nr:class I SAM-dependent methyltransferase [Cyanobacteriota bacterium]
MVDTVNLLSKHHRGAEFSELMVATAPGRFGEAFWQFWKVHLEPAIGDGSPCLLDLGTGPGLVIEHWHRRYPQARYVGVDLMPYMLEKAQQVLADIPRLQLLQADLHDPQLPLAAGSVDVAQAVMVLHEMVQPLRLLQTAHRLLKSGGRLLIVDWVRASIRDYFDPATVDKLLDPATDTAYLDDQITHFWEHNRYSYDDLLWMLEIIGFQLLNYELYNNDRFVRIAVIKP